MADIAAVSLLQERTARESRGVVQQLQGALNGRVLIEQAKGVISEQASIGVDAAVARLRAHAREQNLRLSDLADDIVEGRVDARELTSPVPRAVS